LISIAFNIDTLIFFKEKPKCKILGKATRSLSPEDTVTLKGKVNCYPKLSGLQWRKVGMSKSSDLNHTLEKYKGSSDGPEKPTLVINNIAVEDCGVYILHTRNSKGVADSNEIRIEIKGGKSENIVRLKNYILFYTPLWIEC
jgi:hypothetical protein